MKKIIILTSTLFLISCSTLNDPYLRNINEDNSLDKNKNTLIETNIVRHETIENEKIITNKKEQEQKIKKVEEIREKYRYKNSLEKPVVSNPNDYKNIKILDAEKKAYDKKIEKPKDIKIIKRSESTEITELNEKDKRILKLIKKHYNMIENYDIMEAKTIELISEIKKEQDPDITSTKVLQEIHEMIKETKTKSFVLAVNRVLVNRGIK